MRMPDGWPEDIPSDENLAQRAKQPGNAVLGDEVGFIDPLRKNGGFAEGSVAGW